MPPAGGDAPPPDPEASQQLGQELGSVEGQADANDPAKAIQKMVGKLTQQMRTADENIMTSDFMKSIVNSVISALDVKKFEDADLLSIVKKLKGEDNPEQAGEAQPSGASDEFKNAEGIDYNVNNPANEEGSDQPLKEEGGDPNAKYDVGDPIEIVRPIATFREVFNKGQKGRVKAVSGDGNVWLDLDDGREVGWVTPNFITKIGGGMIGGGGLAIGGRPINEDMEGNEQPNDDQPMQSAALPEALAKVLQDKGLQVNETNVGDLVSAINYFVYESGGDQGGNELTQELQQFAQSIGTADMQGTNVTQYTDLSPMGQDIVDGLEDMAEPAEDHNDAAPNNPQFQMAQTSSSPAMAAEATTTLKDKIMEALKSK